MSHRKLLIKLKNYGIGTQLIRWIKNFLLGRTQTAIVRGASSTRVNWSAARLSSRSPSFLVACKRSARKHYIRALSLCRYNTREDEQVLQRDLNTLRSWSRRWQLSFNIDKCSVLLIKDCGFGPDYYLDGRGLENLNSRPYLGIELAYNLK